MLRLGGHDSVLVPCPAVFAGYMPKRDVLRQPAQINYMVSIHRRYSQVNSSNLKLPKLSYCPSYNSLLLRKLNGQFIPCSAGVIATLVEMFSKLDAQPVLFT